LRISEWRISMMELLLAFVLASLSLLCATYSIFAYYRMVSIAKGIELYGGIRSRNFFQPNSSLHDCRPVFEDDLW